MHLLTRSRGRGWLASLLALHLTLVVVACQETAVGSVPTYGSTLSSRPTLTATVTSPAELSTVQVSQAPASPTSLPTSTAQPSPTATVLPSPSPTATPIGACANRVPSDSLTELVTADYGISSDFVPPGLVPLSEFLPVSVTLGYPTQIREIVADPLVEMVADMQAMGLKPTIISGYRSYNAQAIAWNKWNERHPERVAIISAAPGHSEHQLGTTVDFGSPELPGLVGDDEVEFHTNFYLTSEGDWLAQHAHEYGFTLSFPRETFELTGMYYEPWHFRYVGKEMAAMLEQEGISLISYLISTQPPPCIP